MNYLSVAVCLFVVAVVVDANYPGHGRCKNDDDCGKNRCCVRLGGPFYTMKKCKPLSREGEKCNPDPPRLDAYDFKCPCREGHECVEEVKVKPTKSGSDSSSGSESDEIEYRCRSKSSSVPPEVSSPEPEKEPSVEPEPSREPEPSVAPQASQEPVVEEEYVEIPEEFL